MIGAAASADRRTRCSRARSACRTDWPTRSGCPTGRRARGGRDPPRSGLVQGEPPRFRAGGGAGGFAALAFDQRGHGASPGPMDAGVLDDVARAAGFCGSGRRPRRAGGAARIEHGRLPRDPGRAAANARAVIAICPASGEGLRRGLVSGMFPFEADVPPLAGLLDGHDLHAAVESLRSRSCCCTRRATSRCRSSTRASSRHASRAPQPPDRSARRTPSLGPARPRAARGQPALAVAVLIQRPEAVGQ